MRGMCERGVLIIWRLKVALSGRRRFIFLHITAIQSDSGDEPDTDFLPDPDKIYGPASDEASDGEEPSGKPRLNTADDDDDVSGDADGSSGESSIDSDGSQSSWCVDANMLPSVHSVLYYNVVCCLLALSRPRSPMNHPSSFSSVLCFL